MCLRPGKIYNPTHKLGMNLNQRYEIEIPCGNCCECKEQKKEEWYLRTYWQAKQTWDENGYILFDTLTYNNENLPHVSDFIDFTRTVYKSSPEFDEIKCNYTVADYGKRINLKDENAALYTDLNCSCFKSEDYRLFFVRLRRALDYRGYDSTKLKYFLTSEYGSTEGLTHRPHYHILFFVSDRSLSPITLSNMIDRCWRKGRTDGVGYVHKGWVDSKDYVLKKRVFGRGYNEDENHMRAVCNYVAKYVMKDSEFQSVIDERLKKLMNYLYKEDDYEQRDEMYKKLVHELSQFHRQSKGFGEYAMNFIDDEQKETCMMYIPEKNSPSGKKHIMMPMYYQLKLWYYPYIDHKGKKSLLLTEDGVEWKIRRCKKNIDRLADRMHDWFVNIDLYAKYNQEGTLEANREAFKKKIIDLLDGRTWNDYAQYLLVYKGRIMPDWVRESRKKDDLDSMLNDIYVPCTEECFDEDYDTVFYNYATKLTRKIWKCNFVTTRSIGEFEDVKGGKKKWTGQYSYLNVGYNSLLEYNNGSIKDKVEVSGNNYISPFWFKKLYTYNEDTIDDFRNFDEIGRLYAEFNRGINDAKERAWNLKENIKKRRKDQINAGLI